MLVNRRQRSAISAINRTLLTVTMAVVLPAVLRCSVTNAQSDSGPAREQFVPADQLNAVFERSPQGVMLPRERFQELLKKAQQAEAEQSAIPAGLVIRSATYKVRQDDRHAVVELTVDIEQFADHWVTADIPVGNLLVEDARIGESPAAIIRTEKESEFLTLLHEEPGRFTLNLTLSTPLGTVGPDKIAAFRTIETATSTVTVACPPEQLLEVNDLSLERPAAMDQPVDYSIPAGNLKEIRLKWTGRQQKTDTQTLVFARTDAQLLLSSNNIRWNSTTRVSVFGSAINQLSARVPNNLEITGVESAGLESWKLEDDTDQTGFTRLQLSYRQPFTQDRVLRIAAVAASGSDNSSKVPTLEFPALTSHNGRLYIRHEDQLRLMAKVSSGIRHVGTGASSAQQPTGEIFDFWMQDYSLNVIVKPRDRELFAEINSHLSLANTNADFTCEATVETLNAPLFELTLQLPQGWQPGRITNSDGKPITWREGSETGHIVIEPAAPVPAGGLLSFKVPLNRSIDDPSTPQTLSLPVITIVDTQQVGGTYQISAAPDLTIAPSEVSGLSPIGDDSGMLLFETQGTSYSGQLSVSRKPTRLAARAVLRSWMDTRQKTVEAVVTVDVVNGTTRTLQLQLPENLGDEIRFTVMSIGQVPGYEDQQVPAQLKIIEQTPTDAADGVRTFELTFDQRFSGAVTLKTVVQQARDEDTNLSAPFVRVVGAVRQHGLISFEAYPEQQLMPPAGIDSIDGLKATDSGLMDPPPETSDRRTALVYRYIKPEYAFDVTEKRFDTEAVPSAVCRKIDNISVLSETGTSQRSCCVHFQCSGVQTLRFALPDPDRAYLWSTILNDKAVEVRRDGNDYLVAIPTNQGTTEHVLEILFESAMTEMSVLGKVRQQSLMLSIDTEKGQAAPIDILEQTWEVRYPSTAMLLSHDGGFTPQSKLEQPGWLQALSSMFSLPSPNTLGERLIVPGAVVIVLFVVTVLIVRRRWKSLAGIGCIWFLLFLMILPATQRAREGASPTSAVTDGPVAVSGDGGGEVDYTVEGYGGAMYGDIADAEAATMALPEEEPASEVESLQEEADDEMVVEQLPAPGLGVPRLNRIPDPRRQPGAAGMGGGGLGGGRQGQGWEHGFQFTQPQAGGGILRGSRGLATDDPFTEPADTAQAAPQTPLGGPAGLQSHTIRNIAPNAMPQPNDEAIRADGGSEYDFRLLRKRSGAARLSVRADVASPDDYRSMQFRSISGTPESGTLDLVVQQRSRLNALRMIAATIVLLLCLLVRSCSTTVKTGLAIVLLLAAPAVVPLIPGQWQSVADGVFLGTIAGIALWIAQAGCRCIAAWCRCCFKDGCCGIFKSKTATAALLLAAAAMSTEQSASAAPQDGESSVTRPDVVLPYSPDGPELLADRVWLPKEEFLKLYKKANPDALDDRKAPAANGIVAAFYKSGERKQVRDSQWSQSFSVRYVVRSFSDNAVVQLPIGNVAIRSATLDNSDAILLSNPEAAVPLITNTSNNAPAQQAAQQQPTQQQNQAKAAPPNRNYYYSVRVPNTGLHVLDVIFEVPAVIENSVGQLKLPLRPVPAGTLSFELPDSKLEARVNGRSNVFRQQKSILTIPVAKAGNTQISWKPPATQTSSDTVFHATVNTALIIDDAGLTARSSVTIHVRQGELPETDITLPKGYAVRQVKGTGIASWNTDQNDAQLLKILFQKPVEDKAEIHLTLFRKAVFTKEEQTTDVPVPAIVGASRDSGNVTVVAGRELEVRVNSLSGVSQLNAAEAVLPADVDSDVRRVLAWRYTRQPLAVSVRVFRTADRLVVTSLNGVQLEPQRQLWTTRLQAVIAGAPRRRLEVEVPNDFLALDVTGNDLTDWYYTESSDADTGTRILNLQFSQARTGTVNAVIQGQTGRDGNLNEATVNPPKVLNADDSG